jgi:hypothetical protein
MSENDSIQQNLDLVASSLAPQSSTVIAVRSFLLANYPSSISYDPERGSLRLYNEVGCIVIATSSPEAKFLPIWFHPDRVGITIVGGGDKTTLVASGPDGEAWIKVSAIALELSQPWETG